jgi:hypothetical protein
MYNIAIGGPNHVPITIRAAGPQDVDALRRLAQRDSRAVPEDEMLVAQVDGEARAAVSLATGEVIADPFHRTEELVYILNVRRSQLGGETGRRRRSLKRLLGSRGSSAPPPAGDLCPAGARRTAG